MKRGLERLVKNMRLGVDLRLWRDVEGNLMEKESICIGDSLGKVMERMKRKEKRVD